ncbi:AAA family ATPase [Nostoc sp. UHCC 0926]|uniref:AAA family ATPase n=1 Tax=unclassified Nostoc TaxID=2593658 RepID=UPI002362C563|nr:AAA family ATPase [Nostoc sp. UHCC 0926]WDD32990.1 AAA family ATPase [Nostoc sp. UHCC 0926]
MFIKKLQVFNYKSYLDSGLMEFSPGINILVGRNNAGKTSLLEVLTLDFENHPHRSLKTLPNKLSSIQEESKIEITMHINKEELRSCIKHLSSPIGIPAPELDDNYIEFISLKYENEPENTEYIKYLDDSVKCAFKQFKDFLNNSNFVEISLLLHPGLKLDGKSLKKLLNFESYDEDFNCNFYQVYYDHNELKLQEIDCFDNYPHNQEEFIKYEGKIEESIGKNIFNIFQNSIYRFYAERLNIAICRFENNKELKSDASNLAEVLFILQGKIPGMFDQLNKLVSDILSEIKWISVVMRDDTNVEILIWNTNNLHRHDLSLSLSSCGSGVGQVLAILYIIVSSEEPRTLIIDEPQSFLHPGAAKKLIETIKQFPQHQYFIATHSPEIITTANPSNIVKLQYQDSETTASVVNSKEIESQNEILAELGVRLSDVFGADSILWVEGPTEEKCFPLILEKVARTTLMGIKILSVNSTDALLDGKRSDLVFDIYKKLTTGATLFPPAIGFIFDRESKTETNIQELKKKGVTFLHLPMYENYLLYPEAISVVINEEATWLEIPISITQVQEYLDKIKQEKLDLLQGVKKEEVSDNNWLYKIHGAKIFESMFQKLCDSKLEFRKTKHSYKLTEWLVKNKPDLLSELAEELRNILHKS